MGKLRYLSVICATKSSNKSKVSAGIKQHYVGLRNILVRSVPKF